MPKGKPPLAESDVDLVRRWIVEGAIDDTPASANQHFDAKHPPAYALPPVITALDYSPDGALLAVSGFHEVLLHKADGLGLVARLIGLSERIESIAFSPNGKLLAVTGGQPCRMGEVQIWDVEKRTLKVSFPVTYDTVYGASWSPDNKFVAFGCADNSVRAIEVETGKQVFFNAASSDWVLDTAFSVDGKHLVSVGRDQTVKLFVFDTERFVDNVTSITPGALTGGIPVVDRHPMKDELLVGGSDGVAKTYLMHRTKKRVIGDDHQKILHFAALPGRAFAAAYSPDGNRIAVGSSSNGRGELRVFENADGKEVWKAETQPLYTLDFSPDGSTIAAAGFDGKVNRFQAADGKLLGEFVPVPLEPQAPLFDQAAQTTAEPAANP
jgi:WD40 repeat protein